MLCEVPADKFGLNLLNRFDVYWLQANKHTDTQTRKVYDTLIRSYNI